MVEFWGIMGNSGDLMGVVVEFRGILGKHGE